MSSLAAAAANPYSIDSLKIQVEEQLTNCLRRKVLSTIERVRVDNWQNGIFRIDFKISGCNHYHHLSEKNQKTWDSVKKGNICPVYVENIANEIFPGLSEKMQILTTIFGNDAELETQFSNQLQQFALLFTINIENDRISPSLSAENRENAIQLHQTLHAQMNTPSYANIAQETYQNISARITFDNGSQYAIPLSELLLPLLQLPQIPFS